MSNALRCPKCIFHEQAYRAPLGKLVRNASAGLANAVHDDCNACNGTGYVPGVIIDNIKSQFPMKADQILGELRWSIDHYYFYLGGMYVGVETDGYIHS